MILSKAYDVEVLPNFFSVTVTDLNDYLNTFKDCCVIDKKGNTIPIPLTEKYTVAEIKEKLSKIKRKKFYITDTDDHMLLEMVAYFNNMRPYRNEQGIAIRTDMFAYNSMNYDKLMIACLLMYAIQCNSTKELITKLYETSKKIVDTQDDRESSRKDFYLQMLRKFDLPYTDVDVMRIFALNKVGKGVDAQGNTIFFSKGLKQTSINLKWYELLEYELPPICEKDIHFYHKQDRYRGMTAEQLNELIDKWDRYIIPEYIPPTLHYNDNDVFIVCEIVRLNIDEIRLRYNMTSVYETNFLNSSRSNIADRMFEKFYSEFSNLAPAQWKGKKTERRAMSFNKVIFDFIEFKTPQMQNLLIELKKVILYSLGKTALGEAIEKQKLNLETEKGAVITTINKLTYTIATGGLHSKDIPRRLISKLKYISSTGEQQRDIKHIWQYLTDDSYIYVHYDIASFYPSIMSVYNIAPKHMNEGVFVKLITWLRDTRVVAKHSKDDYIDGIPKDLLAQVLKIVINSIYGKLGYELGDICDRMAVLKVTINGQLMVMMLCEELELNGIEVVSANTDGIVVKLYKRDKEKFDKIANDWLTKTKLEADSEEYNCYVNRDINNYLIQELNGKVGYKGAFNPKMYAVDLSKGYDMPIVAQAVENFFLYNKPVLETLYESTDILDFCKTQNVGKQFNVEFVTNKSSEEMQRYVRYYVSNRGGNIYKVNKHDKSRNNLCSGQQVNIINTLDDVDIKYRDINYTYYYKEALKIIDPIMLGISPNQKGDAKKGIKSGKVLIKKHSGMYNSLFDDLEDD